MDAIIEKIAELYPVMKDQEKYNDVYRGVLEEKFKSSNAEIMNYQGMVFHYKKHTKWSWRDSIYDVLEDECKLPLAVSINKAIEQRFEISQYLLPADKSSIRIYPTRKTKVQSEQEKEKLQELREELLQMTFEKVAGLFIANKLSLSVSEQQYDLLKSQLQQHMVDTKTKSLSTSIGTFKILDNKRHYDVQTLSFENVTKKHAFLSLKTEQGLELLDLFTGQVHVHNHAPVLIDGQLFWYENDELFCEGNTLSATSFPVDYHEDTVLLMQEWLPKGAQFHFGTSSIEGMHFFRHCPISSTKLEDLLDRDLIESKLIESSRYCAKEEDIDLRFEAIDESALQERKTMYHNKILRRAMSKLERDQQPIEADDSDIFAS